MQKINKIYIKTVVKKALDEDLKPKGDITTNLISFKNKNYIEKKIAKAARQSVQRMTEIGR